MSDLIDRQAATDAMKDMYRAAEKWLRDATDDVTKARAESCMASLVEIKLRTEKLPAVQPDHVADVSKKVEAKDCISRQAAIDTIMGQPPEPHYPSWYAAQIEKIPAAQPDHTADIGKKVSISCGHENNDVIFRKMAIEALARMMPHSYTPDGSHPADEEIFRAQEVFADCIEALEILPSAQPETRWIPCSERMPERADNVIICCKAGDYTLVSTGRYLYKFKMWYVDVVGDLRNGVTAWMPLPEPYKGGEK